MAGETLDNKYAPVHVELKNRHLAALWAWLWPGAGHVYQGRYGKGVLFMVCILVTYFFGLAVGGGHVVYASFRKPDIRYPYIFQVGVGLPALPAVIGPLVGSDWMAPPAEPVYEHRFDELASWHAEHGFFFELGTLYTMVAGLLNVLAIYDAYAGPLFMTPDRKAGQPPPDEGKPGESDA